MSPLHRTCALEAHYMINAGFLEEGQILKKHVVFIQHIPCHIVQGRHDVVCPPKCLRALHNAWPGSRLVMIPDGGHAAMEDRMQSALIEATEFCHIFATNVIGNPCRRNGSRKIEAESKI